MSKSYSSSTISEHKLGLLQTFWMSCQLSTELRSWSHADWTKVKYTYIALYAETCATTKMHTVADIMQYLSAYISIVKSILSFVRSFIQAVIN